MRKDNLYRYIPLWLAIVLPVYGHAQQPTTIKEYSKTLVTYPFSDPDPVPSPTHIYPYFRFDGFTDKAVEKPWKIVALENDFITVLITPQIGGKIWTAIDKKNNRPFIYNNDVVKFRDIAMRGPWTSGGIEINYGIFGHTPGVATPVNYITRKNADGSASCILSLLDLLTKTRWSLEVRLPKDKAYFITKSTWHNGTGIYQPYYTWMNMAQKVTDSLEYIFPGDHYIFHDGKVYSWPVNKHNGKHLSMYNQNDFGGSKSYHVLGSYTKYFGAYWQKENYGMMHYAPRSDKIGKKIFIWGLAQSGMIWEDILTDHAGQYTEMQSGRLYNQNAPGSVRTPFKQFYFLPYNTDTWREYWYPFKHTNGVTEADLNGVYNVERNGNTATIYFSAVSYINDTLKVSDKKGKMIFKKLINLTPLQYFQQQIRVKKGDSIGKITLADSHILLPDKAQKNLDRPLKSPDGFNWNTAYGLYLRSKYAAGTKYFDSAEQYIRRSLKQSPFFVPALTQMAYLQYRKMNYDSSFHYAKRALSINTYYPAANYYYGLSARKLHKKYDALDGFQVAAITPQYRSAAYTELSKINVKDHHFSDAFELASKALVANAKNITALQLQYLAADHMGKQETAGKIRDRILKTDPLNHFIRFEKYYQNKTTDNKKHFTALIRDELPQQTYLHLADWYLQIGQSYKAETLLQLAPGKNNEIAYWLAYLHRNDPQATSLLIKADAGSAQFVFPFRASTAVVMRWAMTETDNWKPRYYLALLLHNSGHKEEAWKLLSGVQDSVRFAPLYVTRARWEDPAKGKSILKDYQRAAALNKNDWRYAKYLSEYLLKLNRNKEALNIIKEQFNEDNSNYIIGMLYVNCLIENNDYLKAEKVLSRLHILPYEGATNGHKLFKRIKLMLALQQLQQKHYRKALQKVKESTRWPAHLGVGKPYPGKINHTLSNAVKELIETSRQIHKIPADKIKALKKEISGTD